MVYASVTRAVGTYGGRERDEELAAVGVGAGVGHAHGVGPVVLELRAELVRELAAPDALAARARACPTLQPFNRTTWCSQLSTANIYNIY